VRAAFDTRWKRDARQRCGRVSRNEHVRDQRNAISSPSVGFGSLLVTPSVFDARRYNRPLFAFEGSLISRHRVEPAFGNWPITADRRESDIFGVLRDEVDERKRNLMRYYSDTLSFVGFVCRRESPRSISNRFPEPYVERSLTIQADHEPRSFEALGVNAEMTGREGRKDPLELVARRFTRGSRSSIRANGIDSCSYTNDNKMDRRNGTGSWPIIP